MRVMSSYILQSSPRASKEAARSVCERLTWYWRDSGPFEVYVDSRTACVVPERRPVTLRSRSGQGLKIKGQVSYAQRRCVSKLSSSTDRSSVLSTMNGIRVHSLPSAVLAATHGCQPARAYPSSISSRSSKREYPP